MKRFELEEAAKLSGICLEYFTLFYYIKGYIRKEPYGYSATVLGIKSNCVLNDKNYHAYFTVKSVITASNAFAA